MMLRKSLGVVILISMTLHCASRVGILSLLYEKRHSIAFSMGLIHEIPIAMCSSDYDFSTGLKILTPDSEPRMPVFAQAHEINLYFISAFLLPDSKKVLMSQELILRNSDNYYSSPILSIFHPPAV